MTWERKGTPGKLEFTVIKDGVLNFQEGNPVKLTVNGTTMFYGFVFTKSRKANSVTIDVVAYDQLRYLKNKDTITEEGLKASDLLKRLAADFRLNLRSVEDTGYQRLLLGWRAARLCCLIPRRIIPAPSRPRKGAASPGERKIKKNIRRVSADAIFEKLPFPFKVLSLTCL